MTSATEATDVNRRAAAGSNGPFFTDRAGAGQQLAVALRGRTWHDTVVVGIARGGVAPAAAVARELSAPLDALAVCKARHPHRPELALAAIAPGEAGCVVDTSLSTLEDLAFAVGLAKREAERLDRVLHSSCSKLPLAGKEVILVDDGVATGATAVAATRCAFSSGARNVVVAVPVASVEGIAAILREATLTVCLHTVRQLDSVGRCYAAFAPVIERDVLELLAENRPARLEARSA